MEIESGNRAARALPVAFRARDQDHRAVVALDQPRCDDPDHAFVPVRRRRRRTRDGCGAPPAMHRSAALASRRMRSSTICRSRFRSSSSAAIRFAVSSSSVRSSSSAAVGRPSRPAALIRGARRKPTAPSSTTAGSTRAVVHQRAQARPRGRGKPLEPGERERPVLVDERNDVGDRRERDQVEMLLERLDARGAPRRACRRRRCRRAPGTDTRRAGWRRSGSRAARRQGGGGR